MLHGQGKQATRRRNRAIGLGTGEQESGLIGTRSSLRGERGKKQNSSLEKRSKRAVCSEDGGRSETNIGNRASGEPPERVWSLQNVQSHELAPRYRFFLCGLCDLGLVLSFLEF